MHENIILKQRISSLSYPNNKLIIPFEYSFKNKALHPRTIDRFKQTIHQLTQISSNWQFSDISDKDNELYHHIKVLLKPVENNRFSGVEDIDDSDVGVCLGYKGYSPYLGAQELQDRSDCKKAIHRRWISVFYNESEIGKVKIDWLKLILFRNRIGFWIFNVSFDQIHSQNETNSYLILNKILSRPYHLTTKSDKASIKCDYLVPISDKCLKDITDSPPTNPYSVANSKDNEEVIEVKVQDLKHLVKKSSLKKHLSLSEIDRISSSAINHHVINSKNKTYLSCVADFSFDLFASSLATEFTISSFFNNVYDKQKQTLRPKKYLTFNFMVAEIKIPGGRDDLLQTLLCLRRGHENMVLSDSNLYEDEYELYQPFSNSYWGISREGVANIIIDDIQQGSSSFFTNNYLNRINTYLYLFILVLQQYFSLIQFSQDLSCLPGEMSQYFKGKDHDEKYKKVFNIFERANLFYLKYMFEEVTNISHQAIFYNRIQRVFSIKAMMDELFYELSSVKDIIQSKKNQTEEKRRKFITSIGFVVVLWTTFGGIAEVIGFIDLNDLAFISNFTRCIAALGFVVPEKAIFIIFLLASSALLSLIGYLIGYFVWFKIVEIYTLIFKRKTF